MEPEGTHACIMIDTCELNIPVNLAILEDPPTRNSVTRVISFAAMLSCIAG